MVRLVEPIGVSPFPASSISLLLGRFRRRRFRRTRLFTLRYIRSSSILASAKTFFFVDLARRFSLSVIFPRLISFRCAFRLGYGIGVDARLLLQALPKRHSALKTQDHLDTFSAYGRLACA